MKVTAAVVREGGKPFELEDLLLDEPQADEVCVQIVGVGLCHTDLVVKEQHVPFPMPCVLGHEGAGVVSKVGSAVSKVKPGDHVVLSFASCGQCDHCLAGHPAYCREFGVRNFSGIRAGRSAHVSASGEHVTGAFFGQSSFASYALAHQRNVVKVDEDVPLKALGPLGCGIQTGAGAVLNSLKPAAGSSLAIFGGGSVGLAALLAARVAGCATIIVVDLVESRLQLARELGATHMVNAKEQDAVAEIRRITGDGVQFSVECTGVPRVVRQAVDVLGPLGVCGVIGAAPAGAEVALDINSLLAGKTVRGIIEGDSNPDEFIPRLVALWKQGEFPFDKLISYYPLNDINRAVHDSERGDVLKPVLIP